MDVRIIEQDGRVNILIQPPVVKRSFQEQALLGLTEHDLRDIEFVLAQRRAMSRRCPETDGEHTCSVFPGHPVSKQYAIGHQCRGCDYRWFHSGRPEDQDGS